MRIICLSLLLITFKSFAITPIEGWFLSGFGGYSLFNANSFFVGGDYYINNLEYASGYNAGGSIGYLLGGLQLEATITYFQAQISPFTLVNNQVKLSGSTRASLAMLNLSYNLPEIFYDISPFIGIGYGFGGVSANLLNLKPTDYYWKGYNTITAFQGIAGIHYNFSHKSSISLSYNYTGSFYSGLEEVKLLSFAANNINLGLLWRLG